MADFALRDTHEADIPIFFEHQLDPDANYMAAFTSKDPTDRVAHQERWDRLLADETILKQTILLIDVVVGHVASFDRDGMREVTYWIGREYWGQGLATKALECFLRQETVRPLYARAAKNNAATLRVLEKNGFTVCGEDKGYANARREEVEEHILKLNTERGA